MVNDFLPTESNKNFRNTVALCTPPILLLDYFQGVTSRTIKIRCSSETIIMHTLGPQCNLLQKLSQFVVQHISSKLKHKHGTTLTLMYSDTIPSRAVAKQPRNTNNNLKKSGVSPSIRILLYIINDLFLQQIYCVKAYCRMFNNHY